MFLGLDLGTGSAKALLVAADGRIEAEASAPYGLDAPAAGWAQTEALRWWDAVCHCLQQLPAAARQAVRGVGLSGQMHGVVLADEHGRALHPALLWPDQRAVQEAARYGEMLRARLANPVTPGMAGPLLLWLQRHEPAAFQRARWALQPKDWLRMHLVGTAQTDPSDASGTLLAAPDGTWDEALVTALGLPLHLLPPVLPSRAVAGRLLRSAARELGLPEGVPVAVGAADTAAAAYGSGLLQDGDAQLTVGSGAQIVVMRRACPPRSGVLNAYCAVQGEGLPGWYAIAAMQNAGTALEWVRSLFGLTWETFYEQAFDAARPPSQAMFLPYLSGERTPWMSPSACGAWVGLARSDARPAMLHAALRGVAFSLRAGLEALDPQRSQVRRLHLAGGGTRHPAWRQMLADVLRCELHPTAVEAASAYGAALMAADAIGTRLPRVHRTGAPVLPTPGEDAHAGEYQRFIAHCRALLPPAAAQASA